MFNIMKSRELLVSRLKREARYLLSDLAPSSRRRKITPFVVVCRQRTGSNMLRYALETHPQVVQYGELFHERRHEIRGAHGKYAYRPQSLTAWRRNDARSFLNDVIYRDAMRPIKAVGFKLFYRHGREDGAGNPWPVMAERDDMRIIHLVRANPIAAFVSLERMRQKSPHIQMRGERSNTGSNGSDGSDGSSEPIVLDIEKFSSYLTEYDNDIRRFIAEFGDRKILEVTYESLISSASTLDSILDFLSVERRPLRYQTERQSKGNIVKRIANLTEVAATLRGTRWESISSRL